jgi:transcription elongation factor Elf1
MPRDTHYECDFCGNRVEIESLYAVTPPQPSNLTYVVQCVSCGADPETDTPFLKMWGTPSDSVDLDEIPF